MKKTSREATTQIASEMVKWHATCDELAEEEDAFDVKLRRVTGLPEMVCHGALPPRLG